MNQSTILKKKGPNPNKAQSPFENLDVDMQYRSSAELANKFKIKREQLANECNDRAKKEEDLRTSHMIVGKGQTKQRLFQSGESIQEKGIKVPMNNSRFQTSFKDGVIASVHVTKTTLGNGEVQHDIEDLLNFKHVKRKSVRLATSIDLFLDKQHIHNEHDIHDPIINEHNKGLDDLVDQEELRNIKVKKVRGQTTCKDIHTRNLEERKEVAFDKGQAMGPTNKIVSQLSNFIGTIARNPRFISLMYTSWHVVPKDTKKCMWEYINSKFLIPVEGKKWHAAKDNNEEPSKPEMFIATRTKTGKEIQADTQVAILNFKITKILGKQLMMHLGQCLERSSLVDLGAMHANEITSLKEELREEMRHLFTQLLQNNPGLNFQDIPGCVGSNLASPIDASSAQA
ncbi:hypothetical protein H5410_003875, partial [Solanum commersonii]